MLTAFFVATEFAIVKVRSSRIDQLILEGKKGASSAKTVITHLDEYLSACQLGITVTALGIGWVGESTFEIILAPILNFLHINESLIPILIVIFAFILSTFSHVVIGELAPKTIAIQKAETIALLTAKPIIWFYRVLYPFIWLLNGSARLLVRLLGVKPASEHEEAHTEEELRILLTESFKSGKINKNELKYVNNIFEFDETIAKEIMVPRTEMVTISINDSYEDIIETIKTKNYTRYPIIEGDKDKIRGFIHAKELLTADIQNGNFQIESFIHPIIEVIENIPVHDLLMKMQKERTHIAVLIDEYGGTSGLVTVEDILEEIVGDIKDEFDDDEVAEIQKLGEDHYILDAKLRIEEVNELLNLNLVAEDVETIGGWFITQAYEDQLNKEIEYEGYLFKVHKMDRRHILYLEVTKL